MNETQKIRKKIGLSQSKFAKHFNIPVRTIQKWEINQANPPYYVIDMMKRILKYEYQEIAKNDIFIPDRFKDLFWDCDVNQLNLDKNSEFIVARLYNYGGIEGRMWVDGHYSKEQIKDATCHRRDLDPMVANYLKKQFNLNSTDMAYYQDTVQNSVWKER